MTRVYASLPLSGPGGEVLRGAELAAAGSGIEVVLRDAPRTFDGNGSAAAMANAREAVADAAALAYLGDFFSVHVHATTALLGAAGMLAVAPVATWVELGGPTLVRLMPDDRAGARAIARWLVANAVSDILIVHDHGDEGSEDYGPPVSAMCEQAAADAGIAVRRRPVWDWDEDMADDVAGAQAVLYVGVAGQGAPGLWNALHALDPQLWLLGHEGLAVESFAAGLDSGAAERTRLFAAADAPWGFYGYEAMSLIIDSIAAGGSDRPGVAAAARATRDRGSILGRYSLDADGLTTSEAYGVLRVVDGAFARDRVTRTA